MLDGFKHAFAVATAALGSWAGRHSTEIAAVEHEAVEVIETGLAAAEPELAKLAETGVHVALVTAASAIEAEAPALTPAVLAAETAAEKAADGVVDAGLTSAVKRLAMLLIALGAFLVAGCSGPGHYESQKVPGRFSTTYIMVGKVMVPITNWVPEHNEDVWVPDPPSKAPIDATPQAK